MSEYSGSLRRRIEFEAEQRGYARGVTDERKRCLEVLGGWAAAKAVDEGMAGPLSHDSRHVTLTLKQAEWDNLFSIIRRGYPPMDTRVTQFWRCIEMLEEQLATWNLNS